MKTLIRLPMVLLFLALPLSPFFPQQACAAPGDFLFSISTPDHCIPGGLAVADSGYIYNSCFIYEAGGFTSRVQVFDNAGNLLKKWGIADSGSAVAVDRTGNVYVLVGDVIQVFDSSGSFLTSWTYKHYYEPSSVYGMGLAVSSTGKVYVSDTFNRVQIFDSTGNFLAKFGSTHGESGTENGKFNHPHGLAFDSAGNLYVADEWNHRIQVFDGDGRFLRTWGSYGTGDGQFLSPYAVAVDNSGIVYVGESVQGEYGRVQAFDSNGGIIGKVGTYGMGPNSVATDSGLNRLYVSDSDAAVGGVGWIKVFEGYGGPITIAALTGTPGENGWYRSDIGISFTSKFGATGTKEIHVSVDGVSEVFPGNSTSITVTTEGSHTVQYYAVDNSGHEEIHHTRNLMIDRTLPEITISGIPDGATYLFGAKVPTGSYTVTDKVSGVAQQGDYLTGGDPSAPGFHSYTVQAVDYAGNYAEKMASYSVVYGFGGLISPKTSVNSGSSLPVQFELRDCFGKSVTTASAWVELIYKPDQSSQAGTSKSKKFSTFRFDKAKKVYYYNLDTTGLALGQWEFLVHLDDGTTPTTTFTIVK